MELDKRIFNYSCWIALMSILIFPGNINDDGAKGIEYGFPFRFFTQYHQDSWFIRGVHINLLYYLFNVIIIYFLFLGFREVYKRFSKREIKPEKK